MVSDPIADAIRFVMKEQEKIEERVKKIESLEGITTELDKYMEKRRKEIIKGLLSPLREFSEGEGI